MPRLLAAPGREPLMGTTSLIGSLTESGHVDYVYCYLDGYPEWNG